jgi:hypothetical protein
MQWVVPDLVAGTRIPRAVRAQSIRGRTSLIGLYVPAAAERLPDLRAELLAFPTGKHDDIADALGLIGQLMDKFTPDYAPKSPAVRIRVRQGLKIGRRTLEQPEK